MNIRNRTAALILAAALSLTALSPAAAAEGGRMTQKREFHTSASPRNDVAFTIRGNDLLVRGQLHYEGLDGLMIAMGEDAPVKEPFPARSGEAFSHSISLEDFSGQTLLSVYAKTSGEDTYWSYLWQNLYVNTDGKGNYWIEQNSQALDNNLKRNSAWLNPADCLNGEVSDEVRKLSREIVGGETDDYKKVYLLYDWVAKNIHYDLDFYYKRSKKTFLTVEEAIAHRRSVCEGYTSILAALLDAQGLPNTVVKTYALGLSTSGKYFGTDLDRVRSNHAHNEVFVDGRWVAIDSTWDSNNTYEYGKYLTQPPLGHYYFDISPEALAVKHYVTDRERSSAEDVPTSWAQAGTWEAICAGLVPYQLQGGYRENITRREFCALAAAVYQAAGGGEDAGRMTFTDTADPNMEKMGALGVISGMGDGRADPNGALTREQAAVMLSSLARALGKPLAKGSASFSDSAKVSSWAAEAVGQVQAAGIMSGVDGGRFDPAGRYSREQSILTLLSLFREVR